MSIGDEQFTNLTEYYTGKDTVLIPSSENSLRFQTRLNESNAMKLDDLDSHQRQWKKDIEAYNQKLKDDERERVFNAFRKVVSGKVYFDSIDDTLQQVILELKKGK